MPRDDAAGDEEAADAGFDGDGAAGEDQVAAADPASWDDEDDRPDDEDEAGEEADNDGESVAAPTPARSAAAALIEAIEWDDAGKTVHAGLTGAALIAALAKRLPNSPGVYRMFGADGEILYVGKARSLKKRVANYTRLGGHTQRIARMIAKTHNMEFVTTRTETEALLLEANLIKRLRPRFNVLMRDDKSFPYILISQDHAAPAILKHRGARSRKGRYFGPFASAGSVGRTINALQRAFLLRTCSDSVYDSRTRPCLLYQIKRCSGPCTGEVSEAEYAELVDEATAFLSGRSSDVKTMLSHSMQSASADLDFERAAVYRDRLAALSHVQGHQGINPEGVEEADVFAIHQEGGLTSIQVFFFRTGQNWGNRAYFPKADPSLEPEAVLGAFLAQFYDDTPAPRLVLLPVKVEDEALLAEALALKTGRKVRIEVPSRGAKRDLVDHATSNAREALGRRLAETSSQARLLDGLRETFGLARTPRRIEVYDNSHIMGTNAVGAMIVAGPEGFAKNQYRKFNIKGEDITPGDDFGMMKEVIRRRFSRLIKEHAQTMPATADTGVAADAAPAEPASADPAAGATSPAAPPATGDPGACATARAPGGDVFDDPGGDPGGDAGVDPGTDPGRDAAMEPAANPETDLDTDLADDLAEDAPMPAWPDLVFIDGGKGQMSAVRAILDELGIADRITAIGIAKGVDRDAGRERFVTAGREPFSLPPRDPVLYFVQRLRDEAHRFAIGTHRAKRKKELVKNPLDEIAGIGPSRKRALLHHFGTAKAVSRAALDDLTQVEGISAAMAQSIYDHFRAGG
ncbi:excinuclease ABC subunit UvrC [Aurantimonas sp. 22II-16-19i]|uniref:excinuclease ABC subunit UvrC n=1 Tax=Aurantimonas sp. 22II-16-19i TaxID=1317114 RepID=UPI0009F7D2E3|nr:excinuclease ABC subunit UvrC [Aurantimonas sp. 22II-16-19i]ORE91460.1 excinuclease ABC subunit C [Aurantimonas sp. 22II-16-19i]